MKRICMTLVVCYLSMVGAIQADTERVRSEKRGICVNKITDAEAKQLEAGISWYYNWHFNDKDIKISSTMEYMPMVWGATDKNLREFEAEVKAGATYKHLLSLNEPNLKGQAFVSPEVAAKAYMAAKKVADEHKMKIIGPHMALGSSAGDSIKAYDPLQKKDVTYTYMIPYLDAFFHYLGGVDKVDAIAVHSYGNIHELKWMIGMLEKTYPGKEIWVTEFAWWGAKNETEQIAYLKEAVELFEKTDAVKKYAWFKLHMGNGNRMSLMTEEGQLTALGKAYVNAPVYDSVNKKMIAVE